MMGTKTKGMNGSADLWSLILVHSPTEQMRLNFISQQAAKHWHSLVLEKQGFSEHRISQYASIKKLGRGGFGFVYQAKHVLSQTECAVKVILKNKVEKVFGKNKQPFIEAQLIEDLA